MTCLGVLDWEERGDDNETDLKEGGGIEMSYKCQSTVLSIYAMLALFRLLYFTYLNLPVAALQTWVKILAT